MVEPKSDSKQKRDATAVDTPTAGPKKKKQKTKKKTDVEASPEELQRREAQKKLQQQIREMMKNGESKQDITRVKQEFRNENYFRTTSEKKQLKKDKYEKKKEKAERKAAKKAGVAVEEKPTEELSWWDAEKQKKEKAAELGSKHELVIIPISWKKHAEEREQVNDTCDRVKKRLMEKGVNAWIDWRTLYTPGQKFAYWEHLGVNRRIEIGPQDVSNKTCTMSRCIKAGVPAEKITVSLHGAGVLEKLVEWDLKIDIADEDKEFEDDAKYSEERAATTGDASEENFVLKSDKEKEKKAKKKPLYKKFNQKRE